MKYLLLVLVALPLLANDPPKPSLTTSQRLPKDPEMPVKVEIDPAQPEQPVKEKTFTQLMAERSFKCSIL